MAKYKLFYSPGACSLAVHAVLNATNADYEAINAGSERKNDPEFLKLNPLAQVPVLAEGSNILKEGAAILIYLLENNKNDLLPASGWERAKALQWLAFFNSTMHPAYSAFFALSKNPETSAATKEFIDARINKLWKYVEDEVKTEFVAGNSVTVADILMTVIANWLNHIVPGPKVQVIIGKVQKLPYFAKAMETEGVKYRSF